MTDFVERRRYFRVKDTLELAYKFTQGDEQNTSNLDAQRVPRQLDVDLEKQIQQACQQVRQKSPEVAELFNLLNRKVDQMLGIETEWAVGGESNELPREQWVNLSACGIAFIVSEPSDLGSRLQLKMRLKPADYEVSVVAYVIGCEPMSTEAGSAAYLLRADFADIHDEHQELLIQHVMQCQAKHLRERRHLRS